MNIPCWNVSEYDGELTLSPTSPFCKVKFAVGSLLESIPTAVSFTLARLILESSNNLTRIVAAFPIVIVCPGTRLTPSILKLPATALGGAQSRTLSIF